jgi:hypothetical protein
MNTTDSGKMFSTSLSTSQELSVVWVFTSLHHQRMSALNTETDVGYNSSQELRLTCLATL